MIIIMHYDDPLPNRNLAPTDSDKTFSATKLTAYLILERITTHYIVLD